MEKLLITLFVPIFLAASPFHAKKQIEQISSSVVKIYTTSAKPDYFRPWQKGYNLSSSGTGVVIDGHMVLTAAHVVDNGTFIQIKKSHDAKKYTAKVKWIAHESDLALLEIKDTSFFDNTTPQSFGGLPYRQDGVVVYGYPMGGDEISTTQGIVSRIEQTRYSHGFMDHLMIQIDAPINSGNSGGPAFDQDGNIVGIAIQAISSADGIGYLAPVEVIKHFFDDIKDGVYDGYPDDGMTIQGLENKNIRAFYSLGDRDGVLVTDVGRNSASDGFVKKGDIVLEVDGVDIAGDNTIKLKGNGRISSNYLIRSHQVGDLLHLKILRNNKEINISYSLKTLSSVVPLDHEKQPRYYIFGGVVFMPLSINYLQVWGSSWYSKAPIDLLHKTLNQDRLDEDIKDLVIISNIVPNEENANYGDKYAIVNEVNGKKVISLDSFVALIEKSEDQYINILLDSGRRIILDRVKAFKSDLETMKKYGIGKKQRL